jgi:hypothetical protein
MRFYDVSVNRSVPTEANRGLTSYKAGFSQLIKGGELMLHQNALQAAWISELEEQLAVMTKRKTRKRKQIQHGGTIEYGKAAAHVATHADDKKKPTPERWATILNFEMRVTHFNPHHSHNYT